MTIGNRIKKLRKEKKLSQEQLAEYLGITSGAICKWETNQTYPDIDKLKDIAKLFRVSIDYLLDYKIETISSADEVKRIKQNYKTRTFSIKPEEIYKTVEVFSNHFEVLYYSGTYLSILSLEKIDDTVTEKGIEYLKRAIELFQQNKDLDILLVDIQDKIVQLYISNNQAQLAIDFIKNECQLDNQMKYNLGMCYVATKQYDIAKEKLSEGLISQLVQIINGNLYLISSLYQLNQKEDAVDLCKWMYHFVFPMAKNESSFMYKLSSIILCLEGLIEFDLDQPGYMNTIDESIKIGVAYSKNPTIDTSLIKFSYGKVTSLFSSLSKSVDQECETLISDFEKENGKFKKFREIYQQRLQEIKYES